jgi:hypothetical protein
MDIFRNKNQIKNRHSTKERYIIENGKIKEITKCYSDENDATQRSNYFSPHSSVMYIPNVNKYCVLFDAHDVKPIDLVNEKSKEYKILIQEERKEKLLDYHIGYKQFYETKLQEYDQMNKENKFVNEYYLKQTQEKLEKANEIINTIKNENANSKVITELDKYKRTKYSYK